MNGFSTFQSGLLFDLKRYIRSPSLMFIALATPIAAHFMLPSEDAPYAVLTINELKPVLSAPVLGLELGVLVATLLTPLAYIFLKAGPTRRRPWQVMDVTPHSRVYVTFGRWIADICALWILLGVLTLAGLILGLFKLEGQTSIMQTIIALWLPAAPALALIAAIRLFLDALNLTRRWVGDVVFFIVWLALFLLGTISSIDPKTLVMSSQPLADAFGFTAPVVGSVDYPVTGVAILGTANSQDIAMIDAWKGVTSYGYIVSRFVWLAIAGGLAIAAGLIWAPMKKRMPKAAVNTAKRPPIQDIPFSAPPLVTSEPYSYNSYIRIMLSEITQMLRNRIWLLLLGVAALLGIMMPFRALAGPAILLAIIFPITEASARWQSKSTGHLLNSLGPTQMQRNLGLLAASLSLALLALLPASIRLIAESQWQWLPHVFIIGIVVPAFIVAMGTITRSAVAGRLLMLIAWYVYLASTNL